MPKVAVAYDENAPFPQPVYGTNVTKMDAEYLKRKKEITEDFADMRDGRKICYFLDGDRNGFPILCFHGGCEGKWKFFQKHSIPGVLLVGVDRPGYGGSSSVPVDYTFGEGVDDICQLADHLNLERFTVMGHSVGSSWAIQLAAALPARVTGCILWSTMADPAHPRRSKKNVSDAGRPPAFLNPVSGCCGCILPAVFAGVIKKVAKGDFADALKEEIKADPVTWNSFKNDPFWVSSIVDSMRSYQDRSAITGDTIRTLFSQWQFPTEDVRCPVYIFHGTADYDMGTKYPFVLEFQSEMMPHAVIEEMKGVGHTLALGPNDLTQQRILKAVEGIKAAG